MTKAEPAHAVEVKVKAEVKAEVKVRVEEKEWHKDDWLKEKLNVAEDRANAKFLEMTPEDRKTHLEYLENCANQANREYDEREAKKLHEKTEEIHGKGVIFVNRLVLEIRKRLREVPLDAQHLFINEGLYLLDACPARVWKAVLAPIYRSTIAGTGKDDVPLGAVEDSLRRGHLHDAGIKEDDECAYLTEEFFEKRTADFYEKERRVSEERRNGGRGDEVD